MRIGLPITIVLPYHDHTSLLLALLIFGYLHHIHMMHANWQYIIDLVFVIDAKWYLWYIQTQEMIMSSSYWM